MSYQRQKYTFIKIFYLKFLFKIMLLAHIECLLSNYVESAEVSFPCLKSNSEEGVYRSALRSNCKAVLSIDWLRVTKKHTFAVFFLLYRMHWPLDWQKHLWAGLTKGFQTGNERRGLTADKYFTFSLPDKNVWIMIDVGIVHESLELTPSSKFFQVWGTTARRLFSECINNNIIEM